MGKKRTADKIERGKNVSSGSRSRTISKIPKKKMNEGIIFIEATFNNTKISFTETNGNIVMWVTSSALGFSSVKKATPYAAAKVADTIAEKIQAMGVKEISIVVKGVGGGRESAIRSFLNRGFEVLSIKDRTPIPHNGPRRKKPRRV